MERKFIIRRYELPVEFEQGINEEFDNGYVLHSWQVTSLPKKPIVAVFGKRSPATGRS